MPATLAIAHASFVGSRGPVSSALTLMGCGACLGYMHEEPSNNSRGTRAATAASSELICIRRFSDKKIDRIAH